jgi:hypothetical protein
MTLGNVTERVYGAITSLVGASSIETRLLNAALALAALRVEDFPQSERENFSEIWQSLTQHRAKNDEGSICATICRLTHDESAEIAQKILCLYACLRAYDRYQPSHST